MFYKIKQDFIKESCDNWDKFKSDSLVTEFVSKNLALKYYKLGNVNIFRQQHIKKFFTIEPTRVLFSEITGTGFLNPHRDHNTKVALNYYIQSNDDITTFYHDNDKIMGFSYGNRPESNVYDVKDLTVSCEFVATSNTAYLLDVTKIHSVTKSSLLCRKFISYHWKDHTFDEIFQDLIDMNPGVLSS